MRGESKISFFFVFGVNQGNYEVARVQDSLG